MRNAIVHANGKTRTNKAKNIINYVKGVSIDSSGYLELGENCTLSMIDTYLNFSKKLKDSLGRYLQVN